MRDGTLTKWEFLGGLFVIVAALVMVWADWRNTRR